MQPLSRTFKIFKPFFSDIFSFDAQAIKELFIRSIKFGGFALMALLTLQIDYIIMSQNVDPSGITTYNIFGKFFIIMLFIQTALLSASWPVCSELFNKCRYSEIKNMLRKYIIFGVLLVLCGSALIYVFSDFIIKILAPNTSIQLPGILLALFCFYYI